MVGATVTILYPASAAPFDMKYYLGTHMPLVESKWSKFGLKSWHVTEINNEKYSTQCILFWDSEDAFAKAAAESSEEVMGDIKNFAQASPEMVIGKVVGGS